MQMLPPNWESEVVSRVLEAWVDKVSEFLDTGDIDLVSELTGTFLRLSDFISEYDFPDYQYPEVQAGTKQYHDMVKQMEGYSDLTSEKMGR